MPLGNPQPGWNWAAEGMAPANPWVTSSVATGVVHIEFNYMTRFFQVENDSAAALHVGFTEHGLMTGSNFYSLDQNERLGPIEIKVKELWLSGSGNTYQLIAGLTNTTSSNIPEIKLSDGWQAV